MLLAASADTAAPSGTETEVPTPVGTEAEPVPSETLLSVVDAHVGRLAVTGAADRKW